MPAANTDLARKAAPDFTTQLSGSIISSDTTIPLQSVAGLPLDTAVTITIDETDANGNLTPSNKETVTGVVNSGASTLTNCLRGLDGTTAQAHANGANVTQDVTAVIWNDLITLILTAITQAGLLQPASVLGSMIAGATITGANIATATLTGSLLAAATVTPDKMSAVKLSGVGNAEVGTPPGVNGTFLMQSGTNVVTGDGSGNAFITFPVAFPNGLLAVMATNGDTNTTTAAVGSTLGIGGGVAGFFAHGITGGFRVNWLAIGW